MRTFLSLVLLAALCGCAGYKLGPTNGDVAGSRSVSVQPFLNDTLEPRLSDYVTLELRKRLQQDGTFRLETHDSGDLILSGHITKFDRSELGFQPTDVLTPRDYTLVMVAQITAVERATGKTNLSRTVSGRTTVRVGADLASAERQAVPILAEDLARNAISSLADGSW
ncbi:MAG: hypothetical protein JWO95_1510 [Verrucomicrobiales bacterium]|nr:hypothetical protein [Verrucomicrobiales bacterium]